MLRNRVYYGIKPLIPRALRISARRWMATRKLRRVQNVWPIQPGSETPPEGWSGWPDGKKFALVLTHDVEGPSGLMKCRHLMQLDKSCGFRSSFNFVPEGCYPVSSDLRNELARNGFEVGVHDLKHNGHLYRSRKKFAQNAARINRYLKEWQASGFRSGFMLNQLTWLHDLDIAYDASTFDTDPFEPQPEGRRTIFPFWVSNGDKGYAELPYTLPQDSTLFLLLREQDPSTWIKKFEWVASHGGMVLLNTHPDYMRFDTGPSEPLTYPAEHYLEFLKYVQTRYAGQYWQPLPKEVAAFVARSKSAPPRHKPVRRICMITHSFYENDNRVTRYAEALAQRGDQVDVVALRRGPEVPREETIAGVNVVRLQTRAGKKEQKKLDFLWPLIRFLCVSSLWIARRHRQNRYDLVHVHNIPDFLVFAAWYPKLRGAKVLLDIHDIVPEFYGSKFGISGESTVMKTLKRVERLSATFADHVILANHLWRDKYVARSAAPGKCCVFINNVDAQIFHPRPRARNDGKQIVLFPGGLQWHQGIDLAIRAFQQVASRLPNAEFHIYGDGNMKGQLVALAQELNLNGKVRFFEPMRLRQISDVMADADLGVVPKRADSFGNEAYSTKIMEFMSLGVPVVVSNTKIDRYYFNDDVARFFESGNVDALAAAIMEVLTDAGRREQWIRNASAYATQHSWAVRKNDYLALVNSLCECAGNHP